MNLLNSRAILEKAGIVFEAGLSPREIERIEERFGFVFPEDLRQFLMFALPTGQGFTNWRASTDHEITRALAWPLDGIWRDVQNVNRFWRSEWGVKPSDEAVAYEQLRSRVAKAPKLIPICAHRYMPDRPSVAGNPVFSVFHTDIIYYGSNLENYLHNEFDRDFGKGGLTFSGEIREIEFWSSSTGWLSQVAR